MNDNDSSGPRSPAARALTLVILSTALIVGGVYLDFQLPTDVNPDQYFRTVSAAMVARGWREGPPPNQHMFGRNLSKDGVNAILYPDHDTSTHGVARIYGQCHDMTDHRGAKAEWTDVTDRLH